MEKLIALLAFAVWVPGTSDAFMVGPTLRHGSLLAHDRPTRTLPLSAYAEEPRELKPAAPAPPDELRKVDELRPIHDEIYSRIKDDPVFEVAWQQGLKSYLDTLTDCAVAAGIKPDMFRLQLENYIADLEGCCRDGFKFEPYHKPIPENLVLMEFFGSLGMDHARSMVLGKDNLVKLVEYQRMGHNIIILANHQTEWDTYFLKEALRSVVPPTAPLLDKVVFISGAKTRKDLLTMVLAKGLNLICVHSKRYKNEDLNITREHMRENISALKALQGLMNKGGYVVWVAPSGGRDRRDPETGRIEVSPFDERAIGTFRVVASKVQTPTHFFTLAMLSHRSLMPPEEIVQEVDRTRTLVRCPVYAYWGEELTPEMVAQNYLWPCLETQTWRVSSHDQVDECKTTALHEGFSYVAESEVRRNSETLMELDQDLNPM